MLGRMIVAVGLTLTPWFPAIVATIGTFFSSAGMLGFVIHVPPTCQESRRQWIPDPPLAVSELLPDDVEQAGSALGILITAAIYTAQDAGRPTIADDLLRVKNRLLRDRDNPPTPHRPRTH